MIELIQELLIPQYTIIAIIWAFVGGMLIMWFCLNMKEDEDDPKDPPSFI